ETADLARILGPLALLLLLPVLLTLWMRRAALRAMGRVDPTIVWWGYARFLMRVTMGQVLVWIATAAALGLDDLLRFAFGRMPGPVELIVYCLLGLCPPLLVGAVCQVLSHP